MGNKKREVRKAHFKFEVQEIMDGWLASDDVKSVADIDGRLFNEFLEDHPNLVIRFCEKLNNM